MEEERDQPITNFCKGDVEVKEAEQVQSCLKEEFVFVPQIQIERQLSDVSCPSSVDLQQGVLIYEFQDRFAALLKISEEEALKTCLILTNVHNHSGRTSFQAGTYFSLASLLNKPFFLSGKEDLLKIQSINEMFTWLHWIFHFS